MWDIYLGTDHSAAVASESSSQSALAHRTSSPKDIKSRSVKASKHQNHNIDNRTQQNRFIHTLQDRENMRGFTLGKRVSQLSISRPHRASNQFFNLPRTVEARRLGSGFSSVGSAAVFTFSKLYRIAGMVALVSASQTHMDNAGEIRWENYYPKSQHTRVSRIQQWRKKKNKPCHCVLEGPLSRNKGLSPHFLLQSTTTK